MRASTTREDGRKKANIYINLTKLHSGTLQSLNDEAAAIDKDLPNDFYLPKEVKPAPPDTPHGKKRWGEAKNDKPKRRIIKDIKQFFGPIVDTPPSPEPDSSLTEEFPIVNFRLKGLKKKLCMTDPTMDMMITRKEIGQDIRCAEDEYHCHLDNIPKPLIKREPTMTTDQRLFNKIHGTMGLSCLNAIQQAYRDREKIEQKSAKMEYVLAMKEQRQAAKQRIKLYKDEQRNKTLHQRAGDHRTLVETLEKRKMLRLGYLDKRGEHRHRVSLASRERKRERTFVHDFSVQNTSVSNALLRHDRQAQQEDKMQGNVALISSYRAAEKEQQEIVKKYMEHRILMRQTESAMSRATLDTRMLQEANDRILHARTRVAQQKAKSANVTAALPTTSPSLPPVVDQRMGRQNLQDLRRWNADLNISVMPSGQLHKDGVIPASVM